MTSTRSSILGEGHWNFVEGESLYRDSFVTSAAYVVAHSLPLRGADRNFPFIEDET
jgi:hypothetical protein